MRFLLDTNILIPLEDSQRPLSESLANFVRLANENGHQLVYHPSSEDDINRDTDTARRNQTLERLRQYSRLETSALCPWNTPGTSLNDIADNEILYALNCAAAHALVTEDQGIHRKARWLGLSDSVYTIQTAEDWLRRLYERTSVRLPNIENVHLYNLTPSLGDSFFDSLRIGYPEFDEWFRRKARENNKAWIVRHGADIDAICIYTQQDNETITEEGLTLPGPALKLSTFKVGSAVRGRKIGELFLKAAFRYSTINHIENIFIHGHEGEQQFLFEMLIDFGFQRVGTHPGSGGRDVVYLKRHPLTPPPNGLNPFEYALKYFPHFRHDGFTKKYIVPIKPRYHKILFPDYDSPADRQLSLFSSVSRNDVGNAIKLAYLCHSQRQRISPGDIVLFYRSTDEKALTSIGVVESYDTMQDPDIIARRVKRRTVYSMEEIQAMATRPTRVMLFRLVDHFNHPLSIDWLVARGFLNSHPQSITQINDNAFEVVLANGR
ncbi:MAG: GNAT family N-acetyltransferase [Desulfoprunum sp.]